MIDLNPVPNRLTRPDSLDDDADSFFGKLPQFGADLIALQGNLNSIAAGGAYALPYKFTSDSANIGKGGYLCSPGNGYIYFDDADSSGSGTLARLNEVFASSSGLKAYIKFTAQNDPSRWFLYSVTTSYNHQTGFGYVGIGYVANSGGLAQGEAIVVQIQRTGDKGDAGSTQAVKFSDRKAVGVTGGTSVGVDATQVRVLNTTDYNSIPSGVSLSGNQFSLPAGTYDVWGRAPALAVGNHKAVLYNVTDGGIQLTGSNSYSNGANSDQTDSEFSGRFTLAAPKTFCVRHYTAVGVANNGLGSATSVAGQNETYTEVVITKVN